jgi:ATP/maltotriose-dependent transcriptional regulator MalT
VIGAEGQIVGREAEIEAIEAFLGDGSALPASLAIEGSAGAGKSTLWQAAIDRAESAGFTVLRARAAGAEIQLGLATLADLLEPRLDGVLGELPAPQRRALEIALLLRDDDGAAPDQRATSAGTLNALRALARDRPVLVAIDDAQWLDASSAEIIAFALRRLHAEPVALLTAWRTGSAAVGTAGPTSAAAPERAVRQSAANPRSIALAPDRPAARIEVGPLSLGALNRLLRTRTVLEFNRRTLQRIHETSGGNPFFALELARALEREQGSARAGGEAGGEVGDTPLPLSSSLSDLVADRIVSLEPATRSALLVSAAASPATVDLVERAVEQSAHAVLEPAIAASVARIQGETVEFVHPLFAAAAYSTSNPADRRRWHARIAEVADDPETRARHLAFARTGPDPEAARQVAEAARAARHRGATLAAADLFAQAIDRMPDAGAEMDRAEIVLESASIIALAGEPDRARRLIEESIASIPAGPTRSGLLQELANHVGDEPGGTDRALQFLEQALVEAEGDPYRTAMALLDREQLEREFDRLSEALPIARRALEFAERSGDEFLLAHAHVRVADLEIVLGIGDDPVDRFREALELGARVPIEPHNSAKSMLAVCLIRRGRVDEARPLVLAERARAAAEGDEGAQAWDALFLAELEWLAGRWDEAGAAATEGRDVAEQAGQRMRAGVLTGLVALVEGSRGDPTRARELAREAIRTCEELNEVAYANYARRILGFIELSLGNAAEAHAHLDPYREAQGVEGQKRLSFAGDDIEARVLIGDVDGAAHLASDLARRGAELHRPTLTAAAARGQALVRGARGDLDGALAAAQEAVEIHATLGLPFEHARSLLVLGEVQRRAKQRKAARETLTDAIDRFDRLGAHLWAERAKAERARIGGRTTIEGLSETELRVAELVASGRSNKEVAAELFVSVRAVEANLSRVYAKLGIESRTELARRL